MIQKIRTSRISKIIASYLAIQMVITLIQPMLIYAITSGPTQPEFNAFTPIGTSDMVALSTGDFNYNLPIMDVGGYPINIAYNSGVTMDHEASWVGLGWNLNIGQIGRQVRGIPDDFRGDGMRYENDMKENRTVGSNFGIQGSLFGLPGNIGLNLGMGVQYNNYEGITFHPSYGVSFGISDNVQVGLNISSSTADGATVSPSVKISQRLANNQKLQTTDISGSVGVSINSRKGFQNLTLSTSANRTQWGLKGNTLRTLRLDKMSSLSGGASGSISFNNNNDYTPFKRAGNVNGSFSFNAAVGTEVVGVEVQGHVMGYGSYQKIRSEEKDKTVPAYGYNFSEFADQGNSVMDFTREKDKSFNKNTTVVPISNYTYDIYSIQGQGLGGMFRPHRGQVSYLSDNRVVDLGDGTSAGVEFGIGWNVHVGVDVKHSDSYAYTGGWEDGNYALNKFTESDTDPNSLDYEGVYFKQVGEMNVDVQANMFEDELHGNKAMDLVLGGDQYNRTLESAYRVKDYLPSGAATYTYPTINSKIKRDQRETRNTSIFHVTQQLAQSQGLFNERDLVGNLDVKAHHTAGVKILKPDGSHYIFGDTAYNWEKKEITVDASGASGDCVTGLISNNGNVNGSGNSDEYKNIITTPAYAHSYLLSSVLSPDYEDLTNDGPSEDDLGSYTRFNYGAISSVPTEHYIPSYNWKTPYESGKANYNEGLKSHNKDQKATILRGDKELRYVRTIETKTHVAYFRLSNRKDGREADGGSDYQKKIDNIFLFSKPEFDLIKDAIDGMDSDDIAAQAIKTAHFIYDYELCQGIPNSVGGVDGPVEIANQGGKLTLKKVFFTYRGSNMGRFTPYVFNYEKDLDGNGTIDNNPDYDIKGQDIWGNYKENKATGCGLTTPLNNAEFPFVEQDKDLADENTAAWMLTSIDMPSGGKMEIETEADDYQYVQDRRAMQMFKIHGFGDDNNPFSLATPLDELYQGSEHMNFMYVKIKEEQDPAYTEEDFFTDYLGQNANKPIYFRSLLNMVKNSNYQYDYVSGYFMIDGGTAVDPSDFNVVDDASGTYVAIPLLMLDNEGGWIDSNNDVNPLTKAGWYFGRSQLNRVVYSLGGNTSNTNFVSIVQDLVSSLGAVFEIFTGPNTKLQEKQCAKEAVLNKSWIRLQNPNAQKFGGGLRVTKLQLHDQWDQMFQDGVNVDNPVYQQFYGQEYDYSLDNGLTSGVASFEPNGSKENPFVEPFFDNSTTGIDKLVSPKEFNYTEKPFGESFFPSANVSYGKVTVKNIARENGGLVVGKHATGKVIHEFYTSQDFPTKTDFTEINPIFDPPGPLASIFSINVRNHLAFSQGFVVETNDMSGRKKAEWIYAEGQESPISGSEYKYNISSDGEVSSVIPTVDNLGKLDTNSQAGITYDVYNDFRENYSESTTQGFSFNTAGFVIFIVPIVVPLPIPNYAYHETKLRTASTTKVIHKTAILTEQIAYDLGASVSTKNMVWDAHNGQVLLTKTKNEYNDSYYSFNYPAHWFYQGMDLASQNLGITGTLTRTYNTQSIRLDQEGILTDYFYPGDELSLFDGTTSHRAWVAAMDLAPENLWLMKEDGSFFNDDCDETIFDFTIVRSGFRNQHVASMASVTSMLNPFSINGDDVLDQDLNPESFKLGAGNVDKVRIVNANAVRYSEAWAAQWEQGLPFTTDGHAEIFDAITYGSAQPYADLDEKEYGYNPYLYNVRGVWRAKESFAYLTGRRSHENGTSSPRFEGFFDDFKPYYSLNDTETNWLWSNNNWTAASKVSQYSPFGAELENEDALGRFSAAQYGYNYNLPTAVASNTEYSQIGFDGFEDYSYIPDQNNDDLHFGLYDDDNASTILVDTESHTGRYSLFVEPNESTELVVDYKNDGYDFVYEAPGDCDDPDPPTCTDAGFMDYCAVGPVVMTLSGSTSTVSDYYIYLNDSNGDHSHLTKSLVAPNSVHVIHSGSHPGLPMNTEITYTLYVEYTSGATECFDFHTIVGVCE
ncbi:MAG: hypothetical protein ABJM06_10010 [Gilvibacter sp.]